MRGWSSFPFHSSLPIQVFPAHAGVIHISFQTYLIFFPYFPHMRGWSPVIAFIVYNLFSISRTCGGDPIIFIYKHKDVSYFPHMRGWSYTKVIDGRTNEVFPAHAGVILRQGGWIDKSIGISRTCGGDPLCRNSTLHCGQYFPHMRGWSSGLQTLPKSSAVFPAHAGVILPKPNITLLSLCISRTCGGDPS